MDFRIILVLAGVFGLVYVFKVKNTFARVINWIMVVAIAVSLIRIPEVAIDGYYLFAITQLLVVIYAFSFTLFTIQKKAVITTIGGLSLTASILILGNFPGVLEIGLLAVVIIGLYVYLVAKDVQSYKEEIGFLTILSADAIIRFLYSVMSLS